MYTDTAQGRSHHAQIDYAIINHMMKNNVLRVSVNEAIRIARKDLRPLMAKELVRCFIQESALLLVQRGKVGGVYFRGNIANTNHSYHITNMSSLVINNIYGV